MKSLVYTWLKTYSLSLRTTPEELLVTVAENVCPVELVILITHLPVLPGLKKIEIWISLFSSSASNTILLPVTLFGSAQSWLKQNKILPKQSDGVGVNSMVIFSTSVFEHWNTLGSVFGTSFIINFSYDEFLLERQSFHFANSKLLKSANTQLFVKVL